MPILRPRKRASASSPSGSSALPATTTEPVSARSNPAMTISKVDLPEPDGPTRPMASPRPILSSMSLRICTRAAPRPSDRLTPVSAIASPARSNPEVSCMLRCSWLGCGLLNRRTMVAAGPALPRSYGGWTLLVQTFALIVATLVLAATPHASAAAADRPVRIVALGDSLTAGLGLAANEAFPARLEQALRAKGIAVEISNAGVSGDTATGGLARLDWSVPEGTDAVI